MVYNAEGRPDAGEEVVLCNPVLEEVSQKEDYFEEGCLSFPEIYADVKVCSHLVAGVAQQDLGAPRDDTTTQIYAKPSGGASSHRRVRRNSCVRAAYLRCPLPMR